MIDKLGKAVISKFESFPYAMGYVGRVFYSALFFFAREKAARKILIMQLLFTYIEALALVVIVSTAIGSAIYIAGHTFLVSIGQGELIYKVLVTIVCQELGPLLIAFIVTARSATAIATELAGMVVSHQIESYVSVGVDPIGHLVAPRFIGVTLSVFFLNLYFSLCGLLGPAVVSQFVDPVGAAGYFDGVLGCITLSVIVVSCVKSIFFGMLISIIATYYGFAVERASTEVPVAGIQAVGNSFFGIILIDAFIIVLQVVM